MNRMDDTIAFIGGSTLSFLTFMRLEDIVMAAVLGLVGGFFGIAGKWLFTQIMKGFDDEHK